MPRRLTGAEQPRNAVSRFILDHTALAPARLTPGIRLHLATEVTRLWQATEDFLDTHNMAPPFWAFAWPGAEALALHVAANPALVAGRRVLDFAAGSGLAGIACKRAGAAMVVAADTDPMARAAIKLNAAANAVRLSVLGDVVGRACRWDVILCGDVFYEAPMTRQILPWLRACAATATVLVADPGRTYVPRDGRRELGQISVPTSLDLEAEACRQVTLFQLLP